MPSKYWIKLYHEILDDPKMGRLTDRLFRRCMELFLLAGEQDQDGQLPLLPDMAWRLRLTEEELESDLFELQRINVVCPSGASWFVVHFAQRQSKVDGAERTRQWRERTKKQEYYKGETSKKRSSDDTVTIRHTDTDTDIDKESMPNGSANAPVAGPKTQLMDCFRVETKLKMPSKKDGERFWWSTITELYEISNHDISAGCDLIRRSVAYMHKEGLTIGGPESIIKMCRALAAGQDIDKGRQNGHYQNGKPKSSQPIPIDESFYEGLK